MLLQELPGMNITAGTNASTGAAPGMNITAGTNASGISSQHRLTGFKATPNFTPIFKQVLNSVVQVRTRIPSPNSQIIINGNPLRGESARLGSGFVYDKQGHIVIRYDLVNRAKTLDVRFVDGNTYRAMLLGKIPSSNLAVLQLADNFSHENLIPLAIANSSSLQLGQQVMAIGYPLGLRDTMTTGIITQLGLLHHVTGFSTPGGIQTNAPINPGNSGGLLLNMQGQVIGISTAILSGTGTFSGVVFAIPSDLILKETPIIIQTGTYNHPWLGVSGVTITPDITQSVGLPRNYEGVVVISDQTSSPAEKAGLQGVTHDQSSNTQHLGDIILGIDGHPMRSINDLIDYIDLHKSTGDIVVLSVNRQGQIINMNVVLEARPPSLENPTPHESILR